MEFKALGRFKEATISPIPVAIFQWPLQVQFVGPLNLPIDHVNPKLWRSLTSSYELGFEFCSHHWNQGHEHFNLVLFESNLTTSNFDHFWALLDFCMCLEPPGSILPVEEILVLQKHENNLQLLCTLFALQVSWQVTLPSPSPLSFGGISDELTPAPSTNL